jgi:hypothetical protein
MRYLLIFLLTASVLCGPKAYKFLKENIKRIPSPELQLDNLIKLGIKLNTGISKKDILQIHETMGYNRQPYKILYTELGNENEDGAFVSDNCWHFDYEYIEDHGAYVSIIKNLEKLSHGDLKFENIKDFVDIDEELAWVSFDINGDSYKWTLEVNDDWTDETLFSKVQALAKKYKTKGKFNQCIIGQSSVISYMDNSQFEEFNKVTNLNIEWFK